MNLGIQRCLLHDEKWPCSTCKEEDDRRERILEMTRQMEMIVRDLAAKDPVNRHHRDLPCSFCGSVLRDQRYGKGHRESCVWVRAQGILRNSAAALV